MTRNFVVCTCLILAYITALVQAASMGLPATGWSVNNWKKNQATATWRMTQTPDGLPAIEINFQGDESPTVVSPSLTEISRSWPDQFGSMGMYLRSDGSKQLLIVQFEAEGHTYNAHLHLAHQGWQYFNLMSLWQHEGTPPLQPNRIERINISSATSCNVAIGGVSFAPPGVDMQLQIGSFGYAVRLHKPPGSNGHIDEAVWQDCPWLATKYLLRGGPQETVGKARCRVGFDDQNLYIAAVIQQEPGAYKGGPNLTRRNGNLWDDESVEIFVNPLRDVQTYFQFLCNRLGTLGAYATHFDQVADKIITDLHWEGVWNGAAQVGPNQWTTVMTVPWKTMGAKGPSELVNFQFMHDNWTKDHGVPYAVWSPSVDTPMTCWGLLQLLDQAPGNRPAVVIENLHLRRIAPGRFWVSARLSRSVVSVGQPMGVLRIHGHLADPYGRQVNWDRQVQAKSEQFLFEDELVYDAPVNGGHRFTLEIEPVDQTATLPAAVMATFQQELPTTVVYGQPVLNPRPKRLKWEEGSFTPTADDRIVIAADAAPRTRKTAAYLAERLYGHFGLKLPVIAGDQRGRIRLRIDPAQVRKAVEGSDTAEAYTIVVTKDQVELVGADEPGLYYTVVTLNQLARTAHQPKVPLAAVTLADWPSLHQRVYNEWVAYHVTLVEPPDLNEFKDFLRRVVAGSKYNVFVFTVDGNFIYRKNPGLTSIPLLTPEKFREIADFAREHFLEVVPGTLFGGHSEWVTTTYPNLNEAGFGPQQLDMTKPEVYSLMRDIYGELLDAAGPETRRFFAWHDEWWAHPVGNPTLTLNGLTRQEIYRRDLAENHDFLQSRGVQMMMWTDMLDPQHNGGAPFNLSQIVEKLPRDITMCSWSQSPEWLKNMGFKTLQINNGFSVPAPGLAKCITGFGTIAYTLQHSLFSYVSDDSAAGFSWLCTLRAAEYAWNLGRDPNLPTDEWARQFLPNLMPLYGLADNPRAGDKVQAVVLPANTALTESLGLTKTRQIGGVPMQLGAVRVGAEPVFVTLSQPQRASSLILLHGVQFPDDSARDRTHKAAVGYPYGIPVAELCLNYADGQKATLRLRLGVNTIDMGGKRLNRYVFFGRDVLELPKEQALLLTEWVNPHPDLTIKSVEVVNLWKDAPLLLGGISLRGVAKTFVSTQP